VILHPPRLIGGAPAIQQIDLKTEAGVPGLDQAEFQDHAERAKTSCIICGSLGGVGQSNLSATLAP
jgi:lipoyl-dependent peroxiredoxin